MPLYETVVIGRCGKSAGSANLLRAIAIAIMKQGGKLSPSLSKFPSFIKKINILLQIFKENRA